MEYTIENIAPKTLRHYYSEWAILCQGSVVARGFTSYDEALRYFEEQYASTGA